MKIYPSKPNAAIAVSPIIATVEDAPLSLYNGKYEDFYGSLLDYLGLLFHFGTPYQDMRNKAIERLMIACRENGVQSPSLQSLEYRVLSDWELKIKYLHLFTRHPSS